MQLVGMLGGETPSRSGGDTVVEETFSGKKHEDLEMEERFKKLREEDEDILLILSQFITSNNSN